jgi:Kef-type K+ transport system membrane component KefB
MSATVASAATVSSSSNTASALRRALAALYVGVAAAIALAGITTFVTTTPDEGDFHHIGDYFLTATGIPYVVALVVLLRAMRELQDRRDGRIGMVGMAFADVGSIALLAIFVSGLVAATSSSWGPTYVLASLATIIGVVLFAIGSRRGQLLPKWLLVLWPIAWAVGSMLPISGPGPLLLAAVYIAMAVVLRKRR